MAKKSKKRARQAARRAERRQLPKVPLGVRSRLIERIFYEARDRHAYAAFENEQRREAEERREARSRARGGRSGDERIKGRTERRTDDWQDEG